MGHFSTISFPTVYGTARIWRTELMLAKECSLTLLAVDVPRVHLIYPYSGVEEIYDVLKYITSHI